MKNLKKLILKIERDNALLFAFSFLFYVFFCFFDGVVICVDSPTYINMNLSREPFYPSFLALNRALFGENYLQLVVLWQSLLMAFAVYKLSSFIKKEFCWNFFGGWVIELCCIATSLLCRFAAKRGSMYSNSIMTEGICISLFLLFSKWVLEYMFYQQRKSLLAASVCSLIMISSRKQMYISLALLLAAVLYVQLFVKKKWVQAVLGVFIVSAGVLGGNKVFEYSYSYVIHGETSSHFNDNRFLATMIFFVSEEEDAEHIQDPDVRELFSEILSVCSQAGYTKQSCEGAGLRDTITFFSDHYDHIQIDTMWPMIEAYAEQTMAADENAIARETMTDQITSQIISDLLPFTWTRIAGIFAGSCIHGYFNTVAKDQIYLNIVSVLLGILYLALLVYFLVHDISAGKGLSKESLTGVYVLLAIALNIVVVSMVIFCQTRYMIYNMSLFYIALLALAVSAWRKKKSACKDI